MNTCTCVIYKVHAIVHVHVVGNFGGNKIWQIDVLIAIFHHYVHAQWHMATNSPN